MKLVHGYSFLLFLFYKQPGTTNQNSFPIYHEPIQNISTLPPSHVPLHSMFQSTVIVYAKHRSEHYDYWEYFTKKFCTVAPFQSQVWTYVECGVGIINSTNITDYNCYEPRVNRYGQGSTFGKSDWYPNHMKISYCLIIEEMGEMGKLKKGVGDDEKEEDERVEEEGRVVAVAGWNHKKTQLVRGSLFVVIHSKELHRSFLQLFPHHTNLTIYM